MRKAVLFALACAGLGVSACHNTEDRSCNMQFVSDQTVMLGKHNGDGTEYIAVYPECSATWEARGFVSDHDFECFKTGVVTPGGNPQMGEVTLHKGDSSIDVVTSCVDTWAKQGYR